MSFVKLGEEIIMTLLWQSGASESVTVCFVRLRICCWLFKCGVLWVVCVCVCVRERDRVTHHSGVNYLNCGLSANAYELYHGVCHATLFRLRAWTDAKTKNIINCLYFSFESWSLWLWSYISYISDLCLWFLANHNALGQLANQSRLCLSEGGARRGIEDLQ